MADNNSPLLSQLSCSPQRGLPGHATLAQVWAPDGKSLADVEPTQNPAHATTYAVLFSQSPEMYQMLVKIKSAMQDWREEATYYDGPDAKPVEPGPVEAALILLVDQIQYQLPDEVLRPSFVGGSDNLPF